MAVCLSGNELVSINELVICPGSE